MTLEAFGFWFLEVSACLCYIIAKDWWHRGAPESEELGIFVCGLVVVSGLAAALARLIG